MYRLKHKRGYIMIKQEIESLKRSEVMLDENGNEYEKCQIVR